MFGFKKKKHPLPSVILPQESSERDAISTETAEQSWNMVFLTKAMGKLFLSMNEGVAVHQVVRDNRGRVENYRILDVNPAYELHVGILREHVKGKLATEAYGVDQAPYLSDYARVVETGNSIRFDTTFEPLGKSFSISVVSLDDDIFATIFRDISLEKDAYQSMKSSEERLRIIFEHSPEGYYMRRLDGIFLEVNEAFLAMIGYSREEVLGKKLSDLGVETEADIERVAKIFGQLPQNGISEPIHIEVTQKNGTKIMVEVRVVPMMIGKETVLFGMVRNLTLERIKESQNRAYKRFLEQVIDNIPAMIFVKDAKALKFLQFNRAGEELLGISERDMLGKDDFDFFPKHEAEAFITNDRRVLETGKLLDIPEEEVKSIHRGVRLVHTKKIPIMDEEGNPLYLLGISEDITDQKINKEKINQLSQAVDQSPVSIMITAADGLVEYVNAKYTEMTGYTLGEMVGKNPQQLLRADDTPLEFYDELGKVIAVKGEWHGELHSKKKSGELYWENASITSIKNDKGEITNYLSISEDITQDKEAALQRIKEVARIQKQDDGIIAMAKLINQQELDYVQIIQQIMVLSAEILRVQRVSNWKLSHDGNNLELVDLYDRFEEKHQADELMGIDKIPVYMEALRSNRSIRAVDALVDARTVEFLPYLQEHKISSLLDMPIRVGGKLTGVLCVETGDRREWTDDEVRFASEIADQLAQVVINHEKQLAIEQFEKRSLELEQTNRIMVGRELRMVELKKEIERLKGGNV